MVFFDGPGDERLLIMIARLIVQSILSVPIALRAFAIFGGLGKGENAPWWGFKKGANVPPRDNTKVAFSIE